MEENNKRTRRTEFDAIAHFVDEHGREWTVGAEFKSINGRLDISGIMIWTDEQNTPLTRRVLRELPLETLFKESLTLESEHLPKMLKARSSTTSHQGRAHSDADLRLVADVYLQAYQARTPVQKTVATALGVSVSTAAKRILAARRRGYIPTHKGES